MSRVWPMSGGSESEGRFSQCCAQHHPRAYRVQRTTHTNASHETHYEIMGRYLSNTDKIKLVRKDVAMLKQERKWTRSFPA
jgi:hypothetical protein